MNVTHIAIRKTTLVVLVAGVSLLGAATAQAKPGPATFTRPAATVPDHLAKATKVADVSRPDRATRLEHLDRAPRFRFEKFPT